MTKILITGAFGNAGRYVTLELLAKGYEVLATDIKNKNTKKIAKFVKKKADNFPGKLLICWVDLREENTIKQLFMEHDLSGIIHLAFIIPPFSELYPEMAREVNIEGTRRMVKLAEQHSCGAPFVFGSSVATFGKINHLESPISVNSNPSIPTNNYTTHKITCEKMIKESSLDWRILRFSVVMNPTFRPSRESLDYSRKVPLVTKVEPVHVKDLAIAVHNALIRSDASKGTFIIAGGKMNRITYREYIHRSLNAMIGNIKEEQIPWDKFTEEPYYLHWYDTTESQEILTFQSRTIDNYLQDMKESLPLWQKLVLPFSRRMTLKVLFS
ncbi:MAG: NAD-dependent epimerase/dehydratase family protein [Candidatus Hodarchaeales archaeon]|jgi:nucleoside-diphosphate-sugar epimerase